MRLGFSWAWAGVRSWQVAAWGTLAGCVVLTLSILLTISALLGVVSSEHRDAARNPAVADSASATFSAQWSTSPYRASQLTLLTVTRIGQRDAPAPPGLQQFPEPGQAWLSPSLLDAVTRDPQIKGRIPGKVVGVISPAGLSSPGELFAVVGVPRLVDGMPSASWGTSWAPDGHPRVPLGATLTIVGVLVGFPLSMLALSAARLSGAARRRRCSSLALMGVPLETLSRAASVESGIHALLGSSAGLLLGFFVVPVAARRGWMGTSWFAEESWPPLPLVILSVGTIAVAVSLASARQVPPIVNNPLASSREPAELRFQRSRVAILVLGMLTLSAVALVSRSGDSAAGLQDETIAVFAIGVVVAVVGLVVGLPVLVCRLGGRMPGRSRSTVLTLAGARIAHHGAALVGANVGVAVLLVAGFTGTAVVTDMDAGNASPPGGDVLVISPPGDRSASASGAFQRALRLPSAAALLQVSDVSATESSTAGDAPSALTVAGTCDSVLRLAEASVVHGASPPAAVTAVRRSCRSGTAIPVSSALPDAPGAIPSSAGLSVIGLAGAARLITVSPAAAGLPLQDPHVYVIAGADEATRDAYLNHALALMPTADVQVAGRNTYAVIVPQLQGLIRRCTLIGALLSLLAFLLVALDQAGERRVQDAPLLVAGVGPRTLTRIAAVQNLVVGGVVTMAGGVVGWQVCTAYIAIGHSGASRLQAPLSAHVIVGILLVHSITVATVSRARRGDARVVADLRTT
ncbi:MAG: hypothetical protein U0Q15_08945 [Kineosporiaceae bacterium]